jgi:hypothetical protein
MKKIISLLFASSLLLVGCSSDDDDTPDQEITVEKVFTLDALGAVADQTAAEAKKTISGKWTIGSSSSKLGLSAKEQNCSFDGIEFTETRYIAVIFTGDEYLSAYGSYVMNEATDGTVQSVDLYKTIDGTDQKIASLTNIVVTETANELNATFDIVFNIPDSYDGWPCGDSLNGDYSAKKEEPLEGADDADTDSNLAKLVNVWRLTNYTDTEGGTLENALNEICYNEDGSAVEGCEGLAVYEINFSIYGTYFVVGLSSDGAIGDTFGGDWVFTDAAQTNIQITEFDQATSLVITSITDTDMIFTEPNGDGAVYTLVKVTD